MRLGRVGHREVELAAALDLVEPAPVVQAGLREAPRQNVRGAKNASAAGTARGQNATHELLARREPRPNGLTPASKARAPNAMVALRARQGRAPSVKKQLQNIARALTGQDPSTDPSAQLRRLGFSRMRTGHEAVTYRRGDRALTLRAFTFADRAAVEVTLAGSKKGEERTAVWFQGIMVPEKLWARLSQRYDLELQRFVEASAERGDQLPEDLPSLEAFLTEGMSAREQKAREKDRAEIDAKLGQLEKLVKKLRADGRAPKGIIVYVGGPDAAGKSSTGEIVMSALAGYEASRQSFKAPTAEERAQHWLARFERGIPAEGHAVFWDRGPAGDTVYGPASDAKTMAMGAEFEAFERDLRAQGILPIKIELFADRKKQAKTFGKRLARQVIATRVEQALTERGKIDDEAKAALAEVRGKIDDDDFRAFDRYDEIQGKFMRFVGASGAASPWLVIDATDRHQARLDLIDGVMEQLKAFAR